MNLDTSTIDPQFWEGRRVFVTGHTGFKGGWLVSALLSVGADVTGYALEPTPAPGVLDAVGLRSSIRHITADVRDAASVAAAIASAAPEVVLHLAAQPLVRAGYADPVATYATNVMGTVHVLDAVRQTASVRAALIVTTDKVYENDEQGSAYREVDRLGGGDPYSSSKACAELATAAFRSAYRNAFDTRGGLGIATARSGNVIGGGDWSCDRIVPDVARAMDARTAIELRNPAAVRPWQHVAEPTMGYLLLAQRCYSDPQRYSGAWNFGPASADAVSVGELVERLTRAWTGHASPIAVQSAGHPPEAGLLTLDGTKTARELPWSARMNLDAAVTATAEWYRAQLSGAEASVLLDLTQQHLRMARSAPQRVSPLVART